MCSSTMCNSHTKLLVYCENCCPQSALLVLRQAEPTTSLFTELNPPVLGFQPLVAGAAAVSWVVVVNSELFTSVETQSPHRSRRLLQAVLLSSSG